jgi:DNA repair protein RadA/Sms
MPRTRTKFVCQQCGFESAKWMGRCPDCNEWNSLVETPDVAPGRAPAAGSGLTRGGVAVPVPLPQVEATAGQRRLTGSPELDRVLGGGLVPGSLVLLGGEPGIGKSTLMAQVAGDVALREHGSSVLYVSAEESAQQVKLRADRLGIETERLLLLAETDLHGVAEAVTRVRPALVVIDSIQTVALPEISSAPGSISQVRECTMHLMRLAKREQVPIFLVGHVTKEGTVAGPRSLEHIVDAVLYLEGERFHTYRLLRGVKNRFGATNEVGVYEMRGEGLVDVANPSELFLAERGAHTNGSAVVVSLEGTRPLLVEVQALVTTTNFGVPRCTTNGIDHSRVLMLLAVLTKRVGLALGNQDVYLNVAGGFTLNEPAVDLGVAVAIASSFRERPVPADVALLGEIGLGGELRAVTRADARVREAAKLGFRRCVLPATGPRLERGADGPMAGIEVMRVGTLAQALDAALA